MAAGFLPVFCGDNLFRILDPHVRANEPGLMVTDGLHFKLKADAEGIKGSRIPHVAFIRRGRIPKDFDWSLPFPGAPDLARQYARRPVAAD